MLFNSLDFAVFLPIVFLIYWFVVQRNLRAQNGFIVAASYLFYGWWDWRFLLLIVFSTICDYLVGLGLGREDRPGRRKQLLALSIFINLGLLFFFKYFNFFLDNFRTAFTFFGSSLDSPALNIVLPVGISFYTFQTLSYSIDVYRKKLAPTRDFVAFAAFVSFFPQLVAGPIERATHLLPQFYYGRKFNYGLAVDGCRQILWGFVKKVVIADNCAHFVNIIFDNPADQTGSTLVLGAFLFAFQIYGDFSGYSDIAIGVSRLFGFDLMQNFAFPYFSRDIAEFWRRWHISLSTWFRDYLYIPLGGSRGGTGTRIRNVFAIFLVSGFWHGANWTFICWGALNAIYFLPLMLSNKNRSNLGVVAADSKLPSPSELLAILLTFSLTMLAWVFFRAASIEEALVYLSGIFSPSLFTFPRYATSKIMLLIVIFIGIEWVGRRDQHALETLGLSWAKHWRWILYLTLAASVFLLSGDQQGFIYFQF